MQVKSNIWFYEISAMYRVAAIALAISGCAPFGPSIPDDYSGPVALIKDSYRPYDQRKVEFFCLSKIDDKRIEDSSTRTQMANYGRGLKMTPVVVERNVPAQKATFTLVARTQYAAPILALTNEVYQVTGKITFTPEANRIYVVRGELDDNYSAVWLEDEATGNLIVEKIEVHGSTEAGGFLRNKFLGY